MANDFRSFSLSLDDFSKKVGIAASTVQKRVAVDLFKRIVLKTPRDTGRAQNSWTIAIGEPDRTVAPEGQQPEMNRISLEAKAGTALATLTEHGVMGESVWISNNLPYITALEDGHSKRQAPAGMVGLSIEEVKLKMKGLIGEGCKDAGL